jgi:hypothetical protein
MDPYDVLGVARTASARELAAAYRRLAKRHHPDRTGGASIARMAQINAAYEQLRGGAHRAAPRGPVRPPTAGRHQGPVAGAWLPEPVRWALGHELVGALRPGEPVPWLVHTSTWASPHTVLAVTDRRLLWLLDDAVTHRVRELAFAGVDAIAVRRGRRRDRVSLRVRSRWSSRRWSFADLRPDTADAIARHVADGRGSGGRGGGASGDGGGAATRRGTS